MKKCLFLLVALISLSAIGGEKVFYETTFAKGKWNPKDWTMTKCSRFNYVGSWVQHDKFIANVVPKGATDKELQGKYAHRTYTVMTLNKKISGPCTITSTMEFDYRMAPGLIITLAPMAKIKGQQELRDHLEFILYDEGINMWHHFFENNKQRWRKNFYITDKTSFSKKKPYTVTMKLYNTKRGPFIEVKAGKNVAGYYEPLLFKGEYQIAIVACEGLNRFYDFKVTIPEAKPKKK
jgi:hypothetical protein